MLQHIPFLMNAKMIPSNYTNYGNIAWLLIIAYYNDISFGWLEV